MKVDVSQLPALAETIDAAAAHLHRLHQTDPALALALTDAALVGGNASPATTRLGERLAEHAAAEVRLADAAAGWLTARASGASLDQHEYTLTVALATSRRARGRYEQARRHAARALADAATDRPGHPSPRPRTADAQPATTPETRTIGGVSRASAPGTAVRGGPAGEKNRSENP